MINNYRQNIKIAGGSLLVAGTAIGAGMLGLPMSLAAGGLFFGLLAFVFVWFVMNCSGRALVELSLLYDGEVNLISLASLTLGNAGRVICWVVYLFFFYSVLAAYCSGGMTLLANLFGFSFINDIFIRFCLGLLFITPFAIAVVLGPKMVDNFNRVVMIGLLFSFIVLACHASKFSDIQTITITGELKYVWFTLPLLITSFGFQGLIPSLKNYIGADAKNLNISILFGSALSLLIYLIWIILILSIIPVWTSNGLIDMLHSSSHNPADAIISYLQMDNALVSAAIIVFSVTALLSSLLGVALSMFDFYADGLHIKRNIYGKIKLLVLTFVPPIIFTVVYPTGFLLAINYAGVFAAILLIGYPAIMLWRARYSLGLRGNYSLLGGKYILGLLLLVTVSIVIIVALTNFDLLPVPTLD